MNLTVKQWMPSFTFKFWTVCVSKLPMWGQKCGEIGSSFFSAIMHYAHYSDYPAVLGQKRSRIIESPSMFTRFKASRLFRFPKIKIGVERWPLCFDRRHSEICNREIKSVLNFWLRASYEMAQRSCQRVYSNVGRLFRKNITYLNFIFRRFHSVIVKLTGNTL